MSTPTTGSTALALQETELLQVLQSSLYPGAAVPSIKLVLGYCKASGLDPMQKPVHIVPMWDPKAGAMRDVVMPGINLYRTQASRSQQMAGISDPVFGPMKSEKVGGQDITYPEWCSVTVKRLLPNGTVAEFTATEFWMENYAVKGGKEKSVAPNAMWTKRPRGQLAKCAEAQALRKAFPEIGGAATAEEMEGKTITVEDEQPPAFVVTPAMEALRKEALAAVEAAKTADDLRKMGPQFTPKFRENGDKPGYDAFAAAIQAKGTALRAAQPQTTQEPAALPAPAPATEGSGDPWVADMEAAESKQQGGANA